MIEIVCLIAGITAILLIARWKYRVIRKNAEDEIMSQYMCCNDQEWEPVADLGHAAGVDLDLGQCKNCGTYLMAVFYVNSTTYNVLSKQEAERFLKLQGNSELKKALRRWGDS